MLNQDTDPILNVLKIAKVSDHYMKFKKKTDCMRL
jgi:hypothetical protein